MKQNQKLEVVVIGGGAAGFFAAIACANANLQTKVIILEAGSKPLSKVRISGGGRCNVTHHCFEPKQLIQNYPRGGKALLGAFSRFQPLDTVKWFQSHGVKLKTEADGRMFPITNSSETIINCLDTAAKKAGIIIYTNSAVKTVKKLDLNSEKQFQIELKKGKIIECDRILIATGSNPLGHRWAKQLGHTIEIPVPSLFTFKIDDPRIKNLAGVSTANAKVTLIYSGKKALEQTGALLITHWGLSAPAILKLSAWGARILYENKYNLSLKVNWLANHNQETLKEHFLKTKSQAAKKKIINYCPIELPKRLWQSLVSYIGINSEKNWTEINKKELNKLILEITRGEYKITGKGVFKDEFVTCGGVKLKEVNFKTMESKICSNLYFAGEILDIDGVTGGFNFQSAWTTGWLAGNDMSKAI